MSRALTLIVIAVLLAGCDGAISNEELVSQIKVCEQAGLDWEVWYRSVTSEPVRAVCTKPTPTPTPTGDE